MAGWARVRSENLGIEQDPLRKFSEKLFLKMQQNTKIGEVIGINHNIMDPHPEFLENHSSLPPRFLTRMDLWLKGRL